MLHLGKAKKKFKIYLGSYGIPGAQKKDMCSAKFRTWMVFLVRLEETFLDT